MKKIILCLFAILIFMTGCKNTTAPQESESKTDKTSQISAEDDTDEIIITEDTRDILSSEKQTLDSTSESSSEESTFEEPTIETTTEVTTPAVAQTVTVLIPEGFTVTQIAARLEANNVCTAEGFLEAVNTYDFTY